MAVVLVVVPFLIILLLYTLKLKDPKPIFGIYAVPGKWYYLKYVLFAGLYYFRKYSKQHAAAGTAGGAGQGVKAIADPADMDRAQQLSDHAKAFDAVFFISAKSENDKGVYIISGCERRPMGMCNCVFYIGLPGKGLLCGKKIPDTVLFGAEIGEFGAEGLKITPITPMAKWHISFKGQMWYQNDPTKIVEVDFFGEWKATTKHFDFDTDLYPPAIIRSIAREKWSREYFEGLKTAHQSHYEQFGTLKCKVKIENETLEYSLPSFRDHSFGQKRDWTLMHRYAFHHIFLENGVSISVGVICQPSTASVIDSKLVKEGVTALNNLGRHNKVSLIWEPGHEGIEGIEKADELARAGLQTHFAGPEPLSVHARGEARTGVGEIALPNGEILPVKWVDMKLYQHGEGGQAPRDYAFRFQAGDEEYTVQVLVEYESVHYVSSEWDARMVERFCKFVVNNVPGRGVSEFHYRHKDGRPETVAKNDPEWYRKMCHKI